MADASDSPKKSNRLQDSLCASACLSYVMWYPYPDVKINCRVYIASSSLLLSMITGHTRNGAFFLTPPFPNMECWNPRCACNMGPRKELGDHRFKDKDYRILWPSLGVLPYWPSCLETGWKHLWFLFTFPRKKIVSAHPRTETLWKIYWQQSATRFQNHLTLGQSHHRVEKVIIYSHNLSSIADCIWDSSIAIMMGLCTIYRIPCVWL